MKWKKSPFSEEFGEFERVADLFGLPINYMKKLYTDSKPEKVTKSFLTALENTDYNENLNPATLRSLLETYERDYDRISNIFQTGEAYAPIAMKTVS